MPYPVSVGSTTMAPCRSNRPASVSAAGSVPSRSRVVPWTEGTSDTPLTPQPGRFDRVPHHPDARGRSSRQTRLGAYAPAAATAAGRSPALQAYTIHERGAVRTDLGTAPGRSRRQRALAPARDAHRAAGRASCALTDMG